MTSTASFRQRAVQFLNSHAVAVTLVALAIYLVEPVSRFIAHLAGSTQGVDTVFHTSIIGGFDVSLLLNFIGGWSLFALLVYAVTQVNPGAAMSRAMEAAALLEKDGKIKFRL